MSVQIKARLPLLAGIAVAVKPHGVAKGCPALLSNKKKLMGGDSSIHTDKEKVTTSNSICECMQLYAKNANPLIAHGTNPTVHS